MFTGIGIFGALQARGNQSGASNHGDDKKSSRHSQDNDEEEEAMYSKRKAKMPEETLAALNYANALT